MTSKFRSGFTHAAGTDPALIVQAKIIGVNMANWTVDVYTTYEKHRYLDIQVGSPYLHFNSGEGICVMPELGAQCLLAVPGDSTAPVVLTFVAPHEVSAPQGSTDKGGVTFAAGRQAGKPGDIYLRTRDGNFITLHRGGVLQIGATEVAQRIYIPVGNYITDISGNYNHHNSGGSIVWGLQEGPSTENIPARYTHTFRVHANDKYADIRVSAGKVLDPVSEPNSKEILAELNRLGFGSDPVVYEVVMSPGGFEAVGGKAANSEVRDQVRFKYFFDRIGNVFMRSEGSALAVFQKELVIFARKDITIHCEKGFQMQVEQDIEMESKGYTHLKGNLIKLGAGTTPVARQGDPVIITIPVAQINAMSLVGPITGVITMASPIFGSIMSGSSQVLA
jgi:hypothetical protein